MAEITDIFDLLFFLLPNEPNFISIIHGVDQQLNRFEFGS